MLVTFAFAAVPAVIENGKILDVQQNWKNRQYDTFVLAAPVAIESGKYAGQYVEGIVVKRSAQDQSFYLHEVLLMDENSGRVTPIVPGSLNPKADATPSDAYMPATNSNLAQNAADVKRTAVPANEERANVAVQPTVRPNESSVALGGAKAPSVNSIFQKVRDVKQGKNVDKNRADDWSQFTRLYLPIGQDTIGSVNSIPQDAGTVNTSISDSTGNIPSNATAAQNSPNTAPAAN